MIDALFLKFVHKFFNITDIPWARLVWDNYCSNGKLPGQQKRVFLGGEILSSFLITLNVLLGQQLRMELLFFFGRIFGMM